MDVWVKLTNATKWQAEDLFKRFFWPAPSASASSEASGLDTPQRNRSGLRRRGGAQVGPILEEVEVAYLARRFADAIPEEEMSVWPFFSQSPCFLRMYILFFSGC